MTKANYSLVVHAQLDPDQHRDFEVVRKFHGLHNNADVLRLLIRQEARRIAGDGHRAGSGFVEIMRAHQAGVITGEEALQALATHPLVATAV